MYKKLEQNLDYLYKLESKTYQEYNKVHRRSTKVDRQVKAVVLSWTNKVLVFMYYQLLTSR
jgi:hypothetical protein